MVSKSTNCLFDITEEIAEREGVETTDLPALYEYVNPEALTDIVDSANEDLRIEFSYCHYQITVNGNGSIQILESE